ncbi:beta-lactamase family protein [Actinomadura madurae]|uniref:serine hydrolase domain-containing protein n=1 Tax=Actinomadura madurae TaxID=1993 RepID=UPI00399A5C8E
MTMVLSVRARWVLVLLSALVAGAVATVAPAAAAPRGNCDHRPTERALDVLTGEHGLAGVAVEVDDPRCGRWSRARGVADLASGRPMSAAERLRIGSITKTFTATVVLQLAAEGQVVLDAPVERYLPGLIHGGGYDPQTITVRDLLRHTSGLPDHVDAMDWDHVAQIRYRHYEPRELVELALAQPPLDGGWRYSTTNYVIAGLIVKKVTGHSIGSEITRRIVRRLGLRDTYWPGDSLRILGPHSHSYFVQEHDGVPVRVDGTAWNMTFGDAGGALISSPLDMNSFFTALFSGGLLPAAQLRQMMTTVAADAERLWPGARYGLGLIASPLECGGWWWGHGGTVPGGHRAWEATTIDGRHAAFALTQVPSTQQAENDFLDTVQTVLCESR